MQPGLFPTGVPVGEELALEFEEAMRANHSTHFTTRERIALQALNAELERWSGNNDAFWFSDETLRDDSRWETIRALARDTLVSFEWDLEVPEFGGRTYVTA